MSEMKQRDGVQTEGRRLPEPTGGAPSGESLDAGTTLRVLLADEDEGLAETCRRVLSHEGHECTVVTSEAGTRRALEEGAWDLLLVHEGLPGLQDVDALLQRASAAGPLVTLTVEDGSAERCRRALRHGAWDCLAKPFTSGQLLSLLARASYTVERTHRPAPGRDGRGPLLERGTSILGVSPQIRAAVDQALRVAPTDVPVLIAGESGTGKELFARLIHEKSLRSSATFMPVNCAALPGELLESEMFGHRRGAFSGAVRDKAGILETADRGTVLLDELGEMPQDLQAKLLRVVQDGELRRVGSETVDRTVDVRIISATNRDPREALESGRLREDLLYRLGVVSIRLAPLRERPDDIPVLVRHLTPRLWQRYRPSAGPAPEFTEEAVEALLAYSWPGNVRELENVIGNAVIFSSPGREIRPRDLPFENDGIGGAPGPTGPMWNGRPGSVETQADLSDFHYPYHEAKERMLTRFERAYISRHIAWANGNLCEAARKIRINRTTLYRLMEKHEISRESLMQAALDGPLGEGEDDVPRI